MNDFKNFRSQAAPLYSVPEKETKNPYFSEIEAVSLNLIKK